MLFVLPPFFAFASPQKPLQVQSYPAAVTGGPVAALPFLGSVRNSKAIFRPRRRWPWVRCATPRPSSARSVRFPFSNRKISVTPSHAYSSFHRLLPCLVDVMNYTPCHGLCQYLFSIFFAIIRHIFSFCKFRRNQKASLPLP